MGGAKRTIYELIGGEDALAGVIDDLYARVTADPRLRTYFTGVPPARLKGRQVEFFGSALGGPQSYTGASMRDAHRGRGIEQEHFDLVAAHLEDALRSAGVPGPTVQEIISVVAPLAPEIVSQPLTV
jgi:hemoglobin